ncbi:hypothetical protein MKZ38_010687 [Zalerion maritima]|uniref:Uncharacterized protein n=1 Tax=Zalerion maritima TaxID=339359 RepID=A0AAD5WUX5_9PEZI|nr:hypothetical protein MKZ38_010687 [Zalerion maritima]
MYFHRPGGITFVSFLTILASLLCLSETLYIPSGPTQSLTLSSRLVRNNAILTAKRQTDGIQCQGVMISQATSVAQCALYLKQLGDTPCVGADAPGASRIMCQLGNAIVSSISSGTRTCRDIGNTVTSIMDTCQECGKASGCFSNGYAVLDADSGFTIQITDRLD